MNDNEVKTLLLEYSRKLEKENIILTNVFIAVRTKEEVAFSCGGKEARIIDINELRAEDINIYNIFTKNEHLNALIYASPKYCVIAAES